VGRDKPIETDELARPAKFERELCRSARLIFNRLAEITNAVKMGLGEHQGEKQCQAEYGQQGSSRKTSQPVTFLHEF